MKVLVVGCDGQLGTFLVKSLILTEWHVVALNKNRLDIADSTHVASTLLQYNPDVIINAAAYTSVDKAEENSFLANIVNHCGVINLATAAEKMGAFIIHISTDYVFNGAKLTPYDETDSASPLNVYGETKCAGEIALMNGVSKYILIRTSWLFSECGNNFFTKINHLLKTNTELRVVDDQIGGPTYVGDLVKLIMTILRHVESHHFSSWGVYHYAGYPFVSWYEFACRIKAAVIPDNQCAIHPVSSGHYPFQAKRPLNSCLNSSKVQSVFDLPPSDWQHALNRINRQ
jgi:dTDP-4-dehydrorhamnose reductase